MAGQAGRDVLLKISDGAATPIYTTVAGLRAKTIALSAKSVDATSADSPNAWRELLSGAGLKEASVTGSGVFKDAASDALVRASFFAQDGRVWRLIIPEFGTLEGKFQIVALEYGGAYDGEATFSMTLASAGELGFTPL